MRRRTLLSALAAVPTVAAAASCSAGSSDSSGTASSSASAAGSASDGGDATASASPTPDRLAELVSSFDARQLAGQLLWVGVRAGDSLPDAAFSEARAGGMFLLGTWESADAVRHVLDGARTAASEAEAGVGPLLAVDQEGGKIRMLRGDAARRTASAEDLGTQGVDAVRTAYGSIGEDLRTLGIGVDLAPVADVVDPEVGEDNAPIGALGRGFGTDPAEVAACVEAAVAALTGAGVQATLKHFPGLGRVTGNTDVSTSGITDRETDADSTSLEGFRSGIAAGAGIVMLSSARYPRLDAEAPAMFSRAIVTDLLRGDLGFSGLAVTDDIGAAAAVQDVPVGERATRFLEAGGDVVLTADPGLAGTLADAIVAWAQADEAHAERVRESVTRVLAVKDALGLLP